MKTLRFLARLSASALLVAFPLAHGWALTGFHMISPVAAEETEDAAETDMLVAQPRHCYAIGERIATRNGGTLARVTASAQGGRDVCVMVVLVPAKDGQRPRRAEIIVPFDVTLPPVFPK